MANKLSTEFKSINNKLKRHLRIFAICFAFTEFFCLFAVFYITFFVWLLFTRYFYISIAYFVWMIYDRNSLKRGGHLQWWFRRLFIWKYCSEYFPIRLHKTADLKPNKNYIIGYHPHGIVSLGAYFNFATEATNFSKKFPGITSRLLSLSMHYLFPIHREVTSFSGVCGPQKESLEWILSKNGKGNAAVVVIGGAAEALDAMAHTMHLTLKNRKGFIKIALKHGASLVPCISFGENEIYSHIKFDDNSIIRKTQLMFMKLLTFSSPIFYGRGIFDFIVGYIPYKKQINTIVGKPINVKKIEKPTQQNIDTLHNLYIKSLCTLFKAHRRKFCENIDINIVIK